MSDTSLMKMLTAALLRGHHCPAQPLLTAVGAAGISVFCTGGGGGGGRKLFPGMVAHAFNPNTEEEELGRSLGVKGQPDL